MEAQDGLDELFRSKLEEGYAPVPSFSWDAIQEKVALEKDKKSKKIAFPFLWVAASFLTGLVASGLFFYQYQLETENHYLKELALQNKKEQYLSSKPNTIVDSDLPLLDQKEQSESRSLHKSQQNEGIGTIYETNTGTDPNPSVSNSALTAHLPNKKSRQERAHALPDGFSNESLHTEKTSNLEEKPFSTTKAVRTARRFSEVNKIKHFISQRREENRDTEITKVVLQNGTQASIYASSSKKQKPIASQNESLSTSLNNEESKVSIATTPIEAFTLATSTHNKLDRTSGTLPNKDSLLVAVLDSLPKKEVENKKTANEKEKQKKEPRLFGLPITLGVYVAPEWASRSLKFSGNEDPELVSYKKNDQHKFGYSAGLSLDLKLPERFYVRTGLNYWNVGDQNHTVLKSQPHKTNSSTSDPNKTTTPNSLGPTSPKDTMGFAPNIASDISLSGLSKELSSKTKNNYHYLGIPALLGMKLGRSKLNAGIYSGVLVNVLLSPSRSVYYVYYDPSNPDQYTESYRELSRFSLTYWGGIDVDYKLSKNWTINVSPNVKYSLTALYKDKETVRQLPYSFGVQVGCKYSF